MISDMVLLQELPRVIRESVAAYVGCISGAMQKDEYIGIIQASGFKDVKVIKEAVFPVDSIISDNSVLQIIKDLKLTQDEVKGFANSILSITVQGMK